MIATVKARTVRVVSVAVLAVSGCGTATIPAAPPTPQQASSSSSCADGSAAEDLTVPDPADVRLNVLNASGTDGLALKVFVELGQRGFQMLSTAEGYADPRDYPEAVVIRYGPGQVGAGWLLSFYFSGQVRTQFDARRSDDRLDVILGRAYASVLTSAEVGPAVAAAGRPSAPPGTCVIAG